MFGPDPATSAVTTLGSMLAIDAAGSRWLKYGSTRRHVQSLQVVLADGQVLELGREPLSDGRSASTIPRKRELVNRLAALLAEKAELIRRNQPKCPQNHCGYNLVDVLGDGYLDVARLLVGSEGTLALITEATLGTEPLPLHRGVALLLFDSLDKAARAVPDILASDPTACDLMDRRHLTLAREAEPRFEQLIPAGDRGRAAGGAGRRGAAGSAQPAASPGRASCGSRSGSSSGRGRLSRTTKWSCSGG